MEVPTVLPIKQEYESEGKKFHPNLPDIGLGVKGKGSVLVLLSPRNTGKSTLAVNLYLNPSMFGDPKSPNGSSFEEVYVISPTINVDKSSRHLKKVFTTFISVLPVSTTNPRITNTVTIPINDTNIAVLIVSPIVVFSS